MGSFQGKPADRSSSNDMGFLSYCTKIAFYARASHFLTGSVRSFGNHFGAGPMDACEAKALSRVVTRSETLFIVFSCKTLVQAVSEQPVSGQCTVGT